MSRGRTAGGERENEGKGGEAEGERNGGERNGEAEGEGNGEAGERNGEAEEREMERRRMRSRRSRGDIIEKHGKQDSEKQNPDPWSCRIAQLITTQWVKSKVLTSIYLCP